MKKCSKCKQIKNESEFSKNKTRKDGLNFYCKECSKTIYLKWYEKNHEKCIEKARERYIEYYREERAIQAREWRKKNSVKIKETRRKKNIELKISTFEAYGGALCACCGEDHIEFLSIDHINGNGIQHRKEIGGSGGAHIYRWLKKNDYPLGYQVLCFNCNIAKGLFGICPHQKEERQLLKAVG